MNSEGVYRDGEVLGVDLSELLAPAVVFEVVVHHAVRHLPRSHPVDLEHLQQSIDKTDQNFSFPPLQCPGRRRREP